MQRAYRRMPALVLGLGLIALALVGCQPDGAATGATPVPATAGATMIPTLPTTTPTPAAACANLPIEDRLAWSPEGAHLAYGFQASTVRRVYLWPLAESPDEGTIPPRLIASDGWEFDWHPTDGTLVYASASGRSMTVTDTRGVTRQTVDVGWQHLTPVWAPGGDRLAFVHTSRQRDASGLAASGLQLVQFGDETTAGTLLSLKKIGEAVAGDQYQAIEGWPAWSADGAELAFVFADRLVVATGDLGAFSPASGDHACAAQPAWRPGPAGTLTFLRQTGPAQAWTVAQIDVGGAARALSPTLDGLSVLRFSWSPDGEQLAVLARPNGGDEPADLYLLNETEQSFRAVTATREVAETAVAWSPDGAKLAFVAGNALSLLDLATGTQRQIATVPTR